MAGGTVFQINIASRGGVPKLAVERARIEIDHVAGDKQRNLKFHGGPRRAVCLFSLERIEALQTEGHSIVAGAAGENLTLAAVDWDAIRPGTRLMIGSEVELEITEYTRPCKTIAGCFALGDFQRMNQTVHPGWARVYARVIRTGTIGRGDSVAVLAVATLFDSP